MRWVWLFCLTFWALIALGVHSYAQAQPTNIGVVYNTTTLQLMEIVVPSTDAELTAQNFACSGCALVTVPYVIYAVDNSQLTATIAYVQSHYAVILATGVSL